MWRRTTWQSFPHSQPTFLHIIIPSWQLAVIHQIGSLICNQHDKLMVKRTTLFLLWVVFKLKNLVAKQHPTSNIQHPTYIHTYIQTNKYRRLGIFVSKIIRGLNFFCVKNTSLLNSSATWATVKAETQERGTEIRCKVRQKYDERAYARCEGTHGYRVFSLAV